MRAISREIIRQRLGVLPAQQNLKLLNVSRSHRWSVATPSLLDYFYWCRSLEIRLRRFASQSCKIFHMLSDLTLSHIVIHTHVTGCNTVIAVMGKIRTGAIHWHMSRKSETALSPIGAPYAPRLRLRQHVNLQASESQDDCHRAHRASSKATRLFLTKY